jgi:hypothetical protein
LEALELGIARLATLDTFRKVARLAAQIAEGHEPEQLAEYAVSFHNAANPTLETEAPAPPRADRIAQPATGNGTPLIVVPQPKVAPPRADDTFGFVAW